MSFDWQPYFTALKNAVDEAVANDGARLMRSGGQISIEPPELLNELFHGNVTRRPDAQDLKEFLRLAVVANMSWGDDIQVTVGEAGIDHHAVFKVTRRQ